MIKEGEPNACLDVFLRIRLVWFSRKCSRASKNRSGVLHFDIHFRLHFEELMCWRRICGLLLGEFFSLQPTFSVFLLLPILLANFQGGVVKNLKRRFFILTNEVLCYFKHQNVSFLFWSSCSKFVSEYQIP